jgi:hypothetical protein
VGAPRALHAPARLLPTLTLTVALGERLSSDRHAQGVPPTRRAIQSAATGVQHLHAESAKAMAARRWAKVGAQASARHSGSTLPAAGRRGVGPHVQSGRVRSRRREHVQSGVRARRRARNGRWRNVDAIADATDWFEASPTVNGGLPWVRLWWFLIKDTEADHAKCPVPISKRTDAPRGSDPACPATGLVRSPVDSPALLGS